MKWIFPLLFLPIATICSAAAPSSSSIVPSPGPMAESKGLSALLAVTHHEEKVLKEWESTPVLHAPTIPLASDARRGDTLTVLLFLSGCGSVIEECSGMVDYKVLKPDGEVYADIPNIQAFPSPTKPGVVYLSPGMIRIIIEPTDPLGSYVVLATLREKNTGKLLKLRQGFTVIE